MDFHPHKGDDLPPLRPSFGSMPVHPPRVHLPEKELRARLAATFVKIEEAKAFLARVGDARARLDADRSKAFRKIDKAEAALQRARDAGQPVSVSDAILSGQNVGPGPVKQAKAKLVEAEAEADRIRQLEDQLDKEAAEAERQLSLACGQRDKATAELVAPFALPLLEQYHAAKQRVADIGTALAALPGGALPQHWNSERQYQPDWTLMREWQTAIEVLKTDSTAPLPGQTLAKRQRLSAG